MKKNMIKIFAGLLCVGMLVGLCGCGTPVVNKTNHTAQTNQNNAIDTVTEQPENQSELYTMSGFETIAYDEDCHVYYIREIRTDVMYVIYTQRGPFADSYGMGGMTVMLHPEDGTPLLYSEWVEMGK